MSVKVTEEAEGRRVGRAEVRLEVVPSALTTWLTTFDVEVE